MFFESCTFLKVQVRSAFQILGFFEIVLTFDWLNRFSSNFTFFALKIQKKTVKMWDIFTEKGLRQSLVNIVLYMHHACRIDFCNSQKVKQICKNTENTSLLCLRQFIYYICLVLDINKLAELNQELDCTLSSAPFSKQNGISIHNFIKNNPNIF